MRSAVNQANQTNRTATQNSANYGAGASTIAGSLVPFAQQRLNNPQGYAASDLSAMIANALGGAGGATSGIVGQEQQQIARTRNDAGFGTALDAAARDRTKTLAATGEGIAADNAGVKLQQQDNAARMLGGLYNADVGAQNDSLRTANDATQTAVQAGQTGWLQNVQQLLSTVGSLGTGYSAVRRR